MQSAVFPELSQTFGIGAAPGAVRLAAGIIQLYTIAGQPITALTQQAGYPGGQVGQWESKSEITTPDEIYDEQISMEMNWALGDSMNLQFLTAAPIITTNTYVDWDNTQYTVFNDIFANELDLFSQEIQLSGTSDRLDWVGRRVLLGPGEYQTQSELQHSGVHVGTAQHRERVRVTAVHQRSGRFLAVPSDIRHHPRPAV